MSDKINFHGPALAGKPVSMRLGTKTVSVAAWGEIPPQAQEVEVTAGRLNVIDGALTAPSVGKAVVRSDGKTSLVLFDQKTATSGTALLNGQPVALDIAKALQKEGFQDGLHYWLPLDANNNFVCEPGERHRTWYVTRSASGQTRAQIAAAAGVSESTVNGAWLDARPAYGATPATAVHLDVFILWAALMYGNDKPGRSDHLFFECGHNYRAFDPNGAYGAGGEDELHPLLIAAYGTGTAPIVPPIYTRVAPPFTVWRGVGTEPQSTWWPRFTFAMAIERGVPGMNIHLSETAMMTVRETRIMQPWKTTVGATITEVDPPYAGDVIWSGLGNHTQAFYADKSDGHFVDGCLPHHAGWAEGYSYRALATDPQPMTMYSHGCYFQDTCMGGEVRHTFLARNSSCAFQVRTGGLMHGNIMYDNNIGSGLWGGEVNQPSIMLDSVCESMGYRRVAHFEGGYDYGLGVGSPGCALAGNVVLHGANPDDPEEIGRKTSDWHDGTSTSARIYDDTQTYKWSKVTKNTQGLDPTVLNQTTIYRWVGSKIGKAIASKAEVVAYFATCPSIAAATKEYVAWVKARFGRPIPTGGTPADMVFRPKDWLDGRRWDMRYNWSVQRLPGENVADTADLDGHDVHFTSVNTDIASLRSRGGEVAATSGKLKVGTLLDATKIRTRFAGQVWIDNPGQPVTAVLESGRLVLGAAVASLDAQATGRAQLMLGPDATVPAGKALVIAGPKNKVGWDRTGNATLTIAGKLEMRAGVEMIVGNGTERARRIYQWMGRTVTGSISGATGRIAAVEKWHIFGNLKVWMTDVTGTFVAGDQFQVYPNENWKPVSTPSIVTVSSIVGAGIPQLRRFRSGAVGTGLVEPTVTASLVLASGAQVVIGRRDLLAPGTYDLTGPGVTVTNNGATLPAGVTVTGGKLVLVV